MSLFQDPGARGPLRNILGAIGGIVGGIQGLHSANAIQNNADTLSKNIANAGTTASTNTQNATNTGVTGIDNQITNVGQVTQQGQTGVTNAVNSGQGGVNAATGQSNQVAGQLLNGQLQNLNPYLQTGAEGTNNLQTLAANPFKAPTAAEAAATPGEQFQMQQGLQGVSQQLTAGGGGATGGALKALTQYGQGVASTYYQNAFNNSLNAYNTNVNTNEGLANEGLQASGMANQATQNFGNTYNQNTMGSAYYNSNLGMQGAQSNAQLGLQGAGMQLQGSENAGQLGVTGTLAAGNQNIGTQEAGANLLMQGTEATGAAKAGSWGSITNGMSAIGNAAVNYFMPGGMGASSIPPGGGHSLGGFYGAGAS